MPDANATRGFDHDVARTLRTIPIAARIEIILTAIRHAGIAAGHPVYLITRAITRASAPAVTVAVVWTVIIAAAP